MVSIDARSAGCSSAARPYVSTAGPSVLRRDELGLELSAEPEDPRPIVKAYAGADRLDARATRAGRRVRLDLRIPSIDDLIALKKMRAGEERDAEDIRYLLVRKALEEQRRL